MRGPIRNPIREARQKKKPKWIPTPEYLEYRKEFERTFEGSKKMGKYLTYFVYGVQIYCIMVFVVGPPIFLLTYMVSDNWIEAIYPIIIPPLGASGLVILASLPFIINCWHKYPLRWRTIVRFMDWDRLAYLNMLIFGGGYFSMGLFPPFAFGEIFPHNTFRAVMLWELIVFIPTCFYFKIYEEFIWYDYAEYYYKKYRKRRKQKKMSKH